MASRTSAANVSFCSNVDCCLRRRTGLIVARGYAMFVGDVLMLVDNARKRRDPTFYTCPRCCQRGRCVTWRATAADIRLLSVQQRFCHPTFDLGGWSNSLASAVIDSTVVNGVDEDTSCLHCALCVTRRVRWLSGQRPDSQCASSVSSMCLRRRSTRLSPMERRTGEVYLSEESE